YPRENGEPVFATLFSSAVEQLLGPARAPTDELTQRHKDIARSVQAMYEEAFFHLLNRLHERYKLDALALAGGCAMNSVANGKVYRNTPFTRFYVQSAAGDAGGAIGAAMVAWQQQPSKTTAASRAAMDHAYWGPHYSNEQIGELLAARR